MSRRRSCPPPTTASAATDRRPDMLLLHYTGMPRTDEALAWLCDPASAVSCHYFVFEDGRVVQLVPEARRAWHAGAASWGGETRHQFLLDRRRDRQSRTRRRASRLSGPADRRVTALGRDIVARWSIPPERVLAHSDVAPGRKQDPGERFPGRSCTAPASAIGCRPRPFRDGRALRSWRSGRRGRGRAGHAGAVRLRDRPERPLRRGHRGGRRRLPAPFPPRARRRHRRPVDARHVAGADRRAAASRLA